MHKETKVTVKHVAWTLLLFAACLLSFWLGRRSVHGQLLTNPALLKTDLDVLEAEQQGSNPEPQKPNKAESELIEEALYSIQNRGSAYKELERRRHDTTHKLIEVAGDRDGPPMTRYCAVRLLGVHRDPDAINVLVDNLDWEYRDDLANSISYLSGYPCAEALVQFGPDIAVPVLWHVARARDQDMSDQRLRLRAFLLEAIYPKRDEPWGGDNVIGVVERYVERIPPDWTTARTNVGQLLERLKKPANER